MEDTLPLGNINNLLEFEEFLFIRMKWEFNLVAATISARQGGRWRWLQQQRRRRLYGTMRNWANWISTIILLEDPSLLDISASIPSTISQFSAGGSFGSRTGSLVRECHWRTVQCGILQTRQGTSVHFRSGREPLRQSKKSNWPCCPPTIHAMASILS